MKKITVGALVLSAIADGHILDNCTADHIQFCVYPCPILFRHQFLVTFTGIT